METTTICGNEIIICDDKAEAKKAWNDKPADRHKVKYLTECYWCDSI